MRYSRALLAAALALSAAACGQSVSAPTEPAFDGLGMGSGHNTAPAMQSAGNYFGSGNFAGTGGTASTTTAATDTSTIAGPGSGDGRGVTWGGGQ